MRVACLTMIGVFAAGAAWAASPEERPGLWERTVTRQMEGPPPAPVADPSRLSPEQRARVEAMQATRTVTAPSTAVVRYCVAPGAARDWDAFARDERDLANCRKSVQDDTARSLRLSFACADGSETGTAEFSAAGPDRIQGTITTVRREAAGERKVRIDVDSRWLSPDCGSVKPGESARVRG
jgi:hypothetical protein